MERLSKPQIENGTLSQASKKKFKKWDAFSKPQIEIGTPSQNLKLKTGRLFKTSNRKWDAFSGLKKKDSFSEPQIENGTTSLIFNSKMIFIFASKRWLDVLYVYSLHFDLLKTSN